MFSNPITSLFRSIFYMIDSLIYSLIPSLYSLLNEVADITGYINNSDDIISMISTNIYSLLAVIMLFRVAFSLLTMIADPDKIEDKEKGLSKIVTSVIGCVVLIIVVPIIFRVAGEIQRKILEEKVIESIIMTENYCEQDDFSIDVDMECKPKNTGLYLSYSILRMFLNFDRFENYDAEKIKNAGVDNEIIMAYENAIIKPSPASNEDFKDQYAVLNGLGEYINATYKPEREARKYVFNYTFLLSTLMGIYLFWIVLTFVIDVAYRSVKLYLLQLVAPVAIISFVDPSSASKGIFKKWSEESIKTYLSLFIRIASLAFVSLILYNIKFAGKPFLVKIFFFLAILTLLKTLPKLLETIFGVKPKSKEESFGQSLLRGALGAAAVSTYGGLKGGISAKKHGGSFLGGLAIGASSGFLGAATSAYNGKFGDFAKSFGNSASAVAKTYGFKTGAELRKEKMKYNSDKKYSQKVFERFSDAYTNNSNNLQATSMLNEYAAEGYGVVFSNNEQGQIRKAHNEQESYGSILSAKAAQNRGKLAVKKTESRLLENALLRTSERISVTSNAEEKAVLHNQASRLRDRIGLRKKEVSDLEAEWKDYSRDPRNYRDVEIFNALEMAKLDPSNKLRKNEIDTLLKDTSYIEIEVPSSSAQTEVTSSPVPKNQIVDQYGNPISSTNKPIQNEKKSTIVDSNGNPISS